MAAFTTAALSMVGLPPLAGFFSKWYLALGTIENSSWLLLAVILISSLLNAVYFFRILEKIYLRSSETEEETDQAEISTGPIKRNEVGSSMLWTTSTIAVSILAVGLLNAFIVSAIMTMFPTGL